MQVAPELQNLKGWIPKTRAEAYSLIQTIGVVVGLIIQLSVGSGQSEKPKIEQVITLNSPIFFSDKKEGAKELPSPKSPQKSKVNRNALCPCGSGKKFKKFHGKQ